MAPAGVWQLLALLRKTFLLRLRRPGASLLEVGLPVFLFANVAWVHNLYEIDKNWQSFHPGLHLFPLVGVLFGNVSNSRALHEVHAAAAGAGPVGGAGAACMTTGADNLEAILRELDRQVACGAEQRLRDPAQALLSDGPLGQILTWALDNPSLVSNATHGVVEWLQNVGDLDSLDELRRKYLASEWPGNIESITSALEAEAALLREWRPQYSDATRSRSLVTRLRGPWPREDMEDIARLMHGASNFLRDALGISISQYSQGVLGWFTTGVLNFMLPIVRKGAIRRVIGALFNDTRAAFRYIGTVVSVFETEPFDTLARELDILLWHTSHFLVGWPLAMEFLATGGDQGSLAQCLSFLGYLANGTSAEVSRALSQHNTLAAKCVHGIALELQRVGPELHDLLENATAALTKLEPNLVDSLSKLVTDEFFESLEAVEGGNIPKLVYFYFPRLEQRFRERCPFYREHLAVDSIADSLKSVEKRCPFFKALGTASVNVTGLVHELHAWLDGFSLESLWVHREAGRAVALLNGSDAAEVTRKGTHDIMAAIGAAWRRSNASANASANAPGTGGAGGAAARAPDTAASAGLAEALLAEGFAAYRRWRGDTGTRCDEADDGSDAWWSQLAHRRLLVAPYAGEARRLVELLAVEVSLAASTLPAGGEFLSGLLGCPVVRTALSRGADKVLDVFVRGFPDEASLEAYAAEHPDGVLAGLVFLSASTDTGDFEAGNLTVEYSIRMHAQMVPQTSKLLRNFRGGWITGRCSTMLDFPYYSSGFALLQEFLGRAVARLQAQRELSPVLDGRRSLARNANASVRVAAGYAAELRAEQFPEGSSDYPAITLVLVRALSPLMFMALLPAVTLHVKDVVYEKQERLRDVMRIMGLKTWVYWVALPLFATLQLMALSVLMAVMIRLGGLMVHSNAVVICLFLWLFSAATSSLASLLSAFFVRAKMAAGVGGLVYVASYLPVLLYTVLEGRITTHQQNALCLFSNTCLHMAVDTLRKWELSGEGVHWDNLASLPPSATPPRDGYGQSLLHIFMMLLLDALLYSVLAWYVERVSPGTLGLPQPWYFPLSARFWCGDPPCETAEQCDEDSGGDQKQGLEYYEKPVPGSAVSVAIRGLSKVHPNGKMALHGLSLDMHWGCIMGLLGHNGAGKSTIMSIMCGLYPPTLGDVVVDGVSVRRDAERVRRRLGICMQRDALWDSLSAQEHLELFCRLKDPKAQHAEAHIEGMLHSMRLTQQRRALSRTMSGGKKRCLSIGCALVGGSTILVLDEPTAGIDAETRHEIWQLLMNSKRGRSMLLSTHFMDEAGTLCDRIAVVKEGQLVALGSSSTLTQHFGGGYSLKVRCAPSAQTEQIASAVRTSLPSAVCLGIWGQELVFQLPPGQRHQFVRLYRLLQDAEALEQLGVVAHSLHAATMEAAFQQPGHDSALAPQDWSPSDPQSGDAGSDGPRGTARCDGGAPKASPGPAPPDTAGAPAKEPAVAAECGAEPGGALIGGRSLHRQQLQAILLERAMLARRDLRLTSVLVCLPTVIAAVSIVLAMVRGAASGPEPPLPMSSSMFGPNSTLRIPCSAEIADAALGGRLCAAASAASAHGVPVEALNLTAAGTSMGRHLLDTQFHNDICGALSITEAPGARALVTLWFGRKAYHAMPVMINLWNSVRLKLLGFEGTTVQAWSHPFSNTRVLIGEEMGDDTPLATYAFVVCILALIMAFVSASFVLHPVHDRTTGGKHQHLVTGVPPFVYWAAHFAWDFGTYLIPMMSCVLMLIVCQIDAFTGVNLAAVCTLLLTYGLTSTPLMYCLTPLFATAATAFVTILSLIVFTGVGSILVMFLLELQSWMALDSLDDSLLIALGRLAGVLDEVFTVFPNYCMGRGLINIAQNYYFNAAYTDYGICVKRNDLCFVSPFAWNVSGSLIIALVAMSPVWFAVLLLSESRVLAFRRCCHSHPKGEPEFQQAVHGVVEERSRVKELCLRGGSQGLLLSGLAKAFPGPGLLGRPTIAVSGLHVEVPPCECFGLFGPNGAGKTTTLKLITGILQPLAGDAFVVGHSVRRELGAARRSMGFCPQGDAVPERLKVQEVLELYSRLRGIPSSRIDAVVRQTLKRAQLEAHKSTWTENLSGGNRRKLSVAIALLGEPAVVLLDEPSTGIDVHARRTLWDLLQDLTSRGTAVLLASHSTEECEALCTRISVMARGAFCHIDTVARLVAQCRLQRLLTVKRMPESGGGDPNTAGSVARLEVLNSFLMDLLPDAQVTVDGAGVVHCYFRLPDEHAKVEDIVASMEHAMAGGPLSDIVLDYTISGVCLEGAIFLTAGKCEEDGSFSPAPQRALAGSGSAVHSTAVRVREEETAADRRSPSPAQAVPDTQEASVHVRLMGMVLGREAPTTAGVR